MNPGPPAPPAPAISAIPLHRAVRLARIMAAAAALGVEAKAAWEFLGNPGGGAPLLALLLLHFAACALLALAFLPEAGQSGNRRSFLLFVFAFAFALPLLGTLGIGLGVLPAL